MNISSGCKLTILCRRCDQIVWDVLYGHYKNQILCRMWAKSRVESGSPKPPRATQRALLHVCLCSLLSALSWAQLGPVHEINLCGAPYDLLVLMTDVISEGSGEHMRLRNLVRVSLFTNIKFEMDEDSSDVCTFIVYEFDGFLSTWNKLRNQFWICQICKKKCKIAPFNKNK